MENSHPPICKFFQQGNCRFGTRCRNSHQISEEDLLLRQEEEKISLEVECGICCDKVTGQFGLLQCNCVFCLGCIRTWRDKGKDIAQRATVRLCPLCRTESLDVVPSKYHVTNPERKKKIVESYRIVRAGIPCKNFIPSVPGSCKLGNNCVYAHLLPDGSPAPPEIPPPARQFIHRNLLPRRSSSGHHYSRRSTRALLLPDPSTVTPEILRIAFEELVQQVIRDSGSTHELTEQFIRGMIMELFTDQYGMEQTFDLLTF